jgi:predicted Zn finger-like uncharacterized protein
MALATRCPHCQTVFRIVPDQLKLHRGLVRCGHCREVFDGVLHQVEPPMRPPSAPTPAPVSAPAPETVAPATSQASEIVEPETQAGEEPVFPEAHQHDAAETPIEAPAAQAHEAAQDTHESVAHEAPGETQDVFPEAHHTAASEAAADAVSEAHEEVEHEHHEAPAEATLTEPQVGFPEAHEVSSGEEASEASLAPSDEAVPEARAGVPLPPEVDLPSEAGARRAPSTPPDWDEEFPGDLPPGVPSGPVAPRLDFGHEAPEFAPVSEPLDVLPPEPTFDEPGVHAPVGHGEEHDEKPIETLDFGTEAGAEAAEPREPAEHVEHAEPVEHAAEATEQVLAESEPDLHAEVSDATEREFVAHAAESAEHDARVAGDAPAPVAEDPDGGTGPLEEPALETPAESLEEHAVETPAESLYEAPLAAHHEPHDEAPLAAHHETLDAAELAVHHETLDDAQHEAPAGIPGAAQHEHLAAEAHAEAPHEHEHDHEQTLVESREAHAPFDGRQEPTADYEEDDGTVEQFSHARFGHEDDVIDVEPTISSGSPHYGPTAQSDPWAQPPDSRVEPALVYTAPAIAAAAAASAGSAFAPLADDDRNDFRIRVEPHPEELGEHQHPARRVLGWIVALLLLVLLLAQLAWWQREPVMVRWPQTVNLYRETCAKLGCVVSPPHNIDQLQIETSALTQTTLPNQFELSMSVHNRAALALAWPNVEISLLDANQHVVIRRVVGPAQYLPAGTDLNAGLGADGHQPVRLLLTATGAAPANYSVLIFYP